jgi:hypothetical protein
MKIYDCFLMNSELDILELKLSYLYDAVDFFVIVESKQTLSGISKPLYYQENAERYTRFQDKIIHLIAPNMPGYGHWEYEYFQRNYIKEGLNGCEDDDIILISDVDEIVNLSVILSMPGFSMPALIHLPLYYYYFNLKSNYSMIYNLMAPYKIIKNTDIGNRIDYAGFVSNIIHDKTINTGWHFSNLFADDPDKYVEKIRSFAHQEYNTPYFLDRKRILNCIHYGVDIFERGTLMLNFEDVNGNLKMILPHIQKLGLTNYLYKKKNDRSFEKSSFLIKHKYIPLFKTKTIYLVAGIARFLLPAKLRLFLKSKIKK